MILGLVFEISRQGDLCPVIECDLCGCLINEASEGNYIHELSTDHRELDRIKIKAYVHHNSISGCHSAWEACNPLPERAFKWGWGYLSEFFYQLNHIAAFDFDCYEIDV